MAGFLCVYNITFCMDKGTVLGKQKQELTPKIGVSGILTGAGNCFLNCVWAMV